MNNRGPKINLSPWSKGQQNYLSPKRDDNACLIIYKAAGSIAGLHSSEVVSSACTTAVERCAAVQRQERIIEIDRLISRTVSETYDLENEIADASRR